MSSANEDENVVTHMLVRLNEDGSLNVRVGYSQYYFSSLKRNPDAREAFVNTLMESLNIRIDEAP